MLAFNSSESSIMSMILFSLVSSFTERTSMTIDPSSTTVPACTALPSLLWTANDSPVMDASLIIASPSLMTPSTGMIAPVLILILSPFLISVNGNCLSISFPSPSSSTNHTLSMFNAKLLFNVLLVFCIV